MSTGIIAGTIVQTVSNVGLICKVFLSTDSLTKRCTLDN